MVKIKLAKSAGFCFGVKRAIEIAYQTLAGNKKVCTLGNIVHNEDVAASLEKAGLKKITRIASGKNKIFLIRAHGASIKIINKARKAGFRITDATCPMVKEIHKIAQGAEDSGCTVIVIGDKKHDEVIGIIGQLKNKAILIENPKDASLKKLRGIKKAAIVVQSTQNIEKVLKIYKLLKRRIKDLKLFNTICRPTRQKQGEMKYMPREFGLMIIIGSKSSANTKRLYEISRALNPKSYWVQSEKDIRGTWFKGVGSAGITAGASTPDSATKKVISHIRKIT